MPADTNYAGNIFRIAFPIVVFPHPISPTSASVVPGAMVRKVHPRCPKAMPRCREAYREASAFGDTHWARCFL